MKRHGHCGFTPRGHAGDCAAGWSGAWSARSVGVTDLAGCAAHCRAECPRCQHVSFSALDDDCSWYRMCPQVTTGTSHTSVEVRTDVRRRGLPRIAWLGNPPSACGEAEPSHLKTYCQQFLSLWDAADVMPVPFNSRDRSMPFHLRRAALSFRRSADVLLVPPECCFVPTKLRSCLRKMDLGPDDPPVVVMLNKVFEGLDIKFAAIRELSNRHRVLLVTAPAPLNEAASSVPAASASETRSQTSAPRRDRAPATTWPPPLAFLGYGAGPAFYGRPSERPYRHDVGFSGGSGRFEGRYAWRAETMGNQDLLARLRAHGARIYEGSQTSAAQYIRTLASARMWLSTSEAGDHVVTRAYEVLASGRALLLCDRNPRAHDRLGIVEGVHAAMFNSSAEFSRKVIWYMEHEEERLRMVEAARALAASHTWSNRARELVVLIRKQLQAGRGGDHATSRQPTLASKHADDRDAPATHPFDASCEAAFVYVTAIANLHAECAPRYDKAALPAGSVGDLSWNCIGVVDGEGRQSSPAARAMLQALCLTRSGPARDSSTRTRLLSIHLGSRHTAISHDAAPRHRASRPPEARDGKREVATCPGNQHEDVRHRQALKLLMRDGVVRLDHHWGFARLLLEQPVTGGSETIGSWISRRLDEVARERHPDRRRHVSWDGEIPGIAPVVQAVRATCGRLAREYLGSDADMSHYSAFRLPPNLDLAQYPAGYYHHDRCGHRLKAYLLLTRVTEESHPLRIALGSHRTLFYSHHEMLASRFADEYIETNYVVRSVTGAAGDGFLFDTNAVHKAGGVGLAAQGVRDVMLFEFNAQGRSAAMCAVDRTLPCGCSPGSKPHLAAPNTSSAARPPVLLQ